MKIDEVIWDDAVYPRAAVSQNTVAAYVEALSIGAQFPAVMVQRVVNYTPGGDVSATVVILIDGVHRWHAFKQAGRTDIPVIHYQDAVLDYETAKTRLLLESARNNTSHGDRLSPNDKKRIARNTASSDPECRYKESYLAEKLGVSQQTVNAWITDIRARQRTNRDSTIIRLNRLGWTQEKIAETTKMTQGRVAQIINNTSFGKINNLLAQGRDMKYIAGHYNMELALALALSLEGKTDQERFKELGWGLRTWDQWNFNECDERFGDDWPGRIPAQLVAHTLFYFTKPGDLVLDPMAGGGVVPDVCLVFERKCHAFDLAPSDSRPEIEYHYWNPQKGTWPLAKKPDLIFFDPPYYTKKAKEYKEKAGKEAPSISSFTKKEYEAFFKNFFTQAHENSGPSAIMAFLNADWRDFESTPATEEDTDKAITTYDYNRLLSAAGWKTTHRIECPLSTERLTGSMVKNMQDKRILGTVGRTLLIAKKIQSRVPHG
jgi:transcriptional regulator with XRE-family HTH domain